MATDVAVWKTQQPWLVTSNSTAAGNRGHQAWHSNKLQLHLAGSISKLWHNLMGGTKTVITNNPVVCHEFYWRLCPENELWVVSQALHLQEQASDICSLIFSIDKLNTREAQTWSSNKAIMVIDTFFPILCSKPAFQDLPNPARVDLNWSLRFDLDLTCSTEPKKQTWRLINAMRQSNIRHVA